MQVLGVGDEHQRVIDRGIRLGLKHLAAVCQRVAHRAVHLRDAAQRVSVLHAATGSVRFANLAAFKHLAQIRRRLHLSAVRARFVDALIEGRIGALQRVAAKPAQHIGGIHQRFRGQQCQRAHGQHGLASR